MQLQHTDTFGLRGGSSMRWGLGLLVAVGLYLSVVPPARCENQPVLMLDTADLMASATRGGGAKRQLEVDTAVTLIKTEGEWAYVAKDGTVLGYVLQRQLLH